MCWLNYVSCTGGDSVMSCSSGQRIALGLPSNRCVHTYNNCTCHNPLQPSLVSLLASYIVSRPAFCYIASIYLCTKQAILVRYVSIGDKRVYWFFPLCIMNSKTTVMFYNPHLQLFTGAGEEARKAGRGAEKNTFSTYSVALTCSMSCHKKS